MENPEALLDILTIQSMKERFQPTNRLTASEFKPVRHQQNHNLDHCNDFELIVRELRIDDSISDCFADTDSDISQASTIVRSPGKSKIAKDHRVVEIAFPPICQEISSFSTERKQKYCSPQSQGILKHSLNRNLEKQESRKRAGHEQSSTDDSVHSSSSDTSFTLKPDLVNVLLDKEKEDCESQPTLGCIEKIDVDDKISERGRYQKKEVFIGDKIHSEMRNDNQKLLCVKGQAHNIENVGQKILLKEDKNYCLKKTPEEHIIPNSLNPNEVNSTLNGKGSSKFSLKWVFDKTKKHSNKSSIVVKKRGCDIDSVNHHVMTSMSKGMSSQNQNYKDKSDSPDLSISAKKKVSIVEENNSSFFHSNDKMHHTTISDATFCENNHHFTTKNGRKNTKFRIQPTGNSSSSILKQEDIGSKDHRSLFMKNVNIDKKPESFPSSQSSDDTERDESGNNVFQMNGCDSLWSVSCVRVRENDDSDLSPINHNLNSVKSSNCAINVDQPSTLNFDCQSKPDQDHSSLSFENAYAMNHPSIVIHHPTPHSQSSIFHHPTPHSQSSVAINHVDISSSVSDNANTNDNSNNNNNNNNNSSYHYQHNRKSNHDHNCHQHQKQYYHHQNHRNKNLRVSYEDQKNKPRNTETSMIKHKQQQQPEHGPTHKDNTKDKDDEPRSFMDIIDNIVSDCDIADERKETLKQVVLDTVNHLKVYDSISPINCLLTTIQNNKPFHLQILLETLTTCDKFVITRDVIQDLALKCVNEKQVSCFQVLHQCLGLPRLQEVCDFNGNTLIHIAALRNDSNMVLMLISLGFDVNCKNLSGKTPLQLCLQNSNTSSSGSDACGGVSPNGETNKEKSVKDLNSNHIGCGGGVDQVLLMCTLIEQLSQCLHEDWLEKQRLYSKLSWLKNKILTIESNLSKSPEMDLLTALGPDEDDFDGNDCVNTAFDEIVKELQTPNFVHCDVQLSDKDNESFKCNNILSSAHNATMSSNLENRNWRQLILSSTNTKSKSPITDHQHLFLHQQQQQLSPSLSSLISSSSSSFSPIQSNPVVNPPTTAFRPVVKKATVTSSVPVSMTRTVSSEINHTDLNKPEFVEMASSTETNFKNENDNKDNVDNKKAKVPSFIISSDMLYDDGINRRNYGTAAENDDGDLYHNPAEFLSDNGRNKISVNYTVPKSSCDGNTLYLNTVASSNEVIENASTITKSISTTTWDTGSEYHIQQQQHHHPLPHQHEKFQQQQKNHYRNILDVNGRERISYNTRNEGGRKKIRRKRSSSRKRLENEMKKDFKDDRSTETEESCSTLTSVTNDVLTNNGSFTDFHMGDASCITSHDNSSNSTLTFSASQQPYQRFHRRRQKYSRSRSRSSSRQRHINREGGFHRTSSTYSSEDNDDDDGENDDDDDDDDERRQVNLDLENENLPDEIMRLQRLEKHLLSVHNLQHAKPDVLETVITGTGECLMSHDPVPDVSHDMVSDVSHVNIGEAYPFSCRHESPDSFVHQQPVPPTHTQKMKSKAKSKTKLFNHESSTFTFTVNGQLREMTESEFEEMYDRRYDPNVRQRLQMDRDVQWEAVTSSKLPPGFALSSDSMRNSSNNNNSNSLLLPTHSESEDTDFTDRMG